VERFLNSWPFFCLPWAVQCSCEHVYVLQLSCMKICGTVGHRNALRSSKISWSWYSWALYVKTCKDWFVSMWRHEAFIIPMAFVMHHSFVAFMKRILLMWNNKEWSQTSNEVETVHCPQCAMLRKSSSHQMELKFQVGVQ